jgi:hypothetical protein
MKSEPDNVPYPISLLTIPGRLLLILTLLLSGAAFVTYFLRIARDLPYGTYPILIFAMPIIVLAICFFYGASWMMKKFSIMTFKNQLEQDLELESPQDRIKALSSMRHKGLISQSEFEEQKKRILDEI